MPAAFGMRVKWGELLKILGPGHLLRTVALVAGLSMPVPVLGQAAPVDAPRVAVLSADLGPMARIELTWPGEFQVQAVHDRRVLVLDFASPFNAPDIGALRQRLGGWIAGIGKTGTQLRLTATEDVRFLVVRDRRSLVIEMTWAGGYTPPTATPESVPRDGQITLTPPGARPAIPQQAAAANSAGGGPATPHGPPQTEPPARSSKAAVAPKELDSKAKEALKRLRRSSALSLGKVATAEAVTVDVFQAARLEVPGITATTSDSDAVLTINWIEPVAVQIVDDGRELLLRLDEPVDSAIVAGLAEEMPEWLESASAGYDSLLFVGVNNARFQTVHKGNRTTVTMTRVAASTDVEKSPEDLRLEILRARLKARQGETGKAKAQLTELQSDNPDNVDVVAEMASIEASVGSWRRAENLYDRAISLDPTRRDLASAQRALDREFGSQVRLDWDYQQVKDGDLQIPVVLTARFLPTDMLDAGIIAENRFLDDDEVVRVNGVIEAVTVHRQRAEIFLGGSPATGHRLEGRILGSAGGPGAEVRYDFQTADTVTGLSATWNRAYWELVEGVVDQGVQDQLALRHERQFDRRWSGEVGGSLNRLGADGISTAATSLQLNAAVNYLVPWEAADLSIGYSFDAQYVGTIETRRDINGNAINPLPLTDTEFHSLNLFLSDVFLKDWRYSLFGSVSIDRFGGLGPSVGGELVWEPTDDIQLGLRAGHSRVSGRGDDAVFTRVGGHLLVRF